MSHRGLVPSRVGAVAVLAVLLNVSAAGAQDFPFAFLIANGWKSFHEGGAVRIEQNLFSWYGRGQIHAIVNGQKGAPLGTSWFWAFSRTVPDPTFNSIGPTAGLISLVFGPLVAHLSVIETPSGLMTTVAILDQNGTPDPSVTGWWVLGPGAGVVGGTADDMVVAGIVHFGTPLPAGDLTMTMAPYFPIGSPFSNDQPFYAWGTSGPWNVGSGSSYHSSPDGPIRTYYRSDAKGFYDDYTAAIAVLHAQGDNYLVVSCEWSEVITNLSPQAPVPWCSVSGVGSIGVRVTGRVLSYEQAGSNTYALKLQLHFAP